MSSTMRPTAGFELVVSEDDEDVAYLRLPTHPRGELSPTGRSVRLRDVLGPYEGPDVMLDFDAQGVLVGIELLA